MADPRDKYQQYVCPEEFNERLREVGGVNRYDQNNFIVRWAQGGEDECFFRSGGAWNVEGLPSFKGYRDLLVGGGTPSWLLMVWEDATVYSTPEVYYLQNYDEDTGMQNLGEYPYSGRYRILYNMVWRDMSGGKMKFESMPLNSFILDSVVPIIVEAKSISWEKTKATMKALEEKANQEDTNKIEDIMRDASVPFKGAAVSYTRQGCRTSLIDKKIEAMTRNWNKMIHNAKSLGRGLTNREAILDSNNQAVV